MLENEKIWILQNILSNVEEHNSAKLLRESLFKIIDGLAPLITASGAGVYTGTITPASEVPTEVGDKVFLVTQPGTYTNFGNVVLPENNFGFIFKNGNNFSIQSVEMPIQVDKEINVNSENSISNKAVSEKILSYTLDSGNIENEKAFKDVVKNIFVDTNGHGGKYVISYFIKNYAQYGRLGVQIAQADATTVVGTWRIPTDAVLESGKIYELEPTSSEVLILKGFKVYIEVNDFAEFGTESFLQGTNGLLSKVFDFTGVDNPVINELMKVKKSTQNVDSLETFVLKGNENTNVLNWFSYLQNIYVYNKTGVVSPDKYQINYIWHNTNSVVPHDGRFGFQLSIDDVASNYGFPIEMTWEEIPKGVMLKVPARIGESLKDTVDVYFEFKKEVIFPTENLFYGLTTPVRPLLKSALLNDEIKFLDTFRPLDYEQPTILKAYASDNPKKWVSVIKNLYIIDPEYLPTDVYKISYFWLNDASNKKFVFQITKNDANPSNYGTNNVLPNTLVNIPHINEAQPLKKLKVIVEFEDFETFPTDVVFSVFNPNKNIFLPKAFDYQKTITIINQTKSDDGIIINDVRLNVVTNGVNAVQNALEAITDASPKNIYNLRVKSGLYKVTNSSQFLGYPGYPAMILAKDYVNIIGESKNDCIVWAELPYNDAEIDTNINRNLHQTIYNWAECTIENITFVGKNIRYVLHQDNPNESNKTRYYKNCDFLFYGNKGSITSLGIGTWSGSKTYVEGGRSYSDYGSAFACHNNQVFSTPSKWSFKGHTFATLNSINPITLQNSGSLIGDVLNLENCKLEGGFVLNYIDWWIYTPNVNDHFNHADWIVRGSGNEAMLFNNNVNGKSLKIEASTIGKNIRFDKTSSAYNIIISNQYDYFGNLGHPERKIVDKYIVFDATIGLKSYAIGGKSIREDNYIFGTQISEDSLGKRLGDCSVTNKVLGVIIGNETINIVFNKNYTALTNAQVINEINTSLNGKAIASEYNVGADYYAEFTDVNYVLYNNSTTDFIPKNTLVTKIGNKISVAQENDIVFGLAIDDIHPLVANSDGSLIGKGRVIRNCIVKNNSLRLSNGVSIQRNKKYSSNNGELVENINGDLIGYDNDYLLIK